MIKAYINIRFTYLGTAKQTRLHVILGGPYVILAGKAVNFNKSDCNDSKLKTKIKKTTAIIVITSIIR